MNFEKINTVPIPAAEDDTLKFKVASSKDEAEALFKHLPQSVEKIFSDGSGYKAGIGVAAW